VTSVLFGHWMSLRPLLSTNHSLLSALAGCVYRIPTVGIRFRRFIEARFGARIGFDRAFWNDSLNGWASAYLGGTLSIDIRNAVTASLVHRLAPEATSVLDLGCAGASLAGCLGPTFQAYCGVDISDVAIDKARETLAATAQGDPVRRTYALAVAPVQDFRPSQRYDVIVFNEVLYYLSLTDVVKTVRRYSAYLSDNGLIIVSMKDSELSRLIQSVIVQELRLEYSVLYQQQPSRARWKTTRNRETPAYLVQALRIATCNNSVL
jgi:2-polyprenyl-3-methyl-5-hydroxy-6-metoxy-1,4-benzoquinol methylase